MIDKISVTAQYISSACENVVFKCSLVLAGLLINFSFGDISTTVLTALFMLILFDFLTGIWAAKRSGEDIKSSKVFRTAWKFVLYFLAVSAGYFTELVIGTDLFIAKTIMVFLAATELISILENIQKAGYEMPGGLIRKIKNLISSK